MTKRIGIASILTVTLLFVVAVAAPLSSYSTWQSCGPIQIVGDDDELWCFVQINRIVHRPGMFVSAPNITMGHTQSVLVVSTTGERRRIEVSIPNGVSFHPNSSRIVRLEDAFYLFQDFSLTTHRSAFRWKTDHFELLPFAESERLFQAVFANHPEQKRHLIGEIQSVDGWTNSFASSGLWPWSDSTFDWNSRRFKLTHFEKEGTESVFAREIAEPTWNVELAAFQKTVRTLTHDGYEELSNRPQQQGHSRDFRVKNGE